MRGWFVARRILAGLLLLASAALTWTMVGELDRVATLETDRAEIDHIRYGMLDADQWAARITAILAKRVDGFELTAANRPQVVKAVERVLDTMLDEIEHYLRRRNLSGGGTWMDQLQGVLKQGVQDLLVDFDKLHQRVPEYAEAVVEQLGKPQAKAEIKAQLTSLVQWASDSTFAKTDRSGLESRLARYGCHTAQECSARLDDALVSVQALISRQLAGLVATLIPLVLLSLPWRYRSVEPDAGRLDPFGLACLTGVSLILLAGGIFTPMMEIEARISDFSLELLGEPLHFSDQVLYFQTKSIVQVVWLLAEKGTADMWLVALLIALFSVVFPTLKLIAGPLYYYDVGQAGSSSWVRFFALRSGKWSMADVMVVAIFMAYIGLDGLVANQLGSLARLSPGGAPGGDLLTSNGTTLAPGFYLFLAFVLVSLLLSDALERYADRSTGRWMVEGRRDRG